MDVAVAVKLASVQAPERAAVLVISAAVAAMTWASCTANAPALLTTCVAGRFWMWICAPPSALSAGCRAAVAAPAGRANPPLSDTCNG